MAVSLLLALSCQHDLGPIQAWGLQALPVLGRVYETVCLPSNFEPCRLGIELGMSSGLGELLAKIKGTLLPTSILLVMAKVCKEICAGDSWAPGQSCCPSVS